MNNFTRVSELFIQTQYKYGRTILSDCRFSAPFKIMKPFTFGKDGIKIMPLSASAGIMSGDEQSYNIEIGENSKAEIVSQAYEKIHKMENGSAKRKINIKIGKGAFLKYTPLPVIPFAKSAFESKADIYLDDESSALFMSDVLSCGRVSRGELFEYTFFNSKVCIYENESLVYRDNIMFSPNETDISGMGMTEGYTHILNIAVFNINYTSEKINRVLDLIDSGSEITGGISEAAENKLIIRVLGKGSEKLMNFSEDVYLSLQ